MGLQTQPVCIVIFVYLRVSHALPVMPVIIDAVFSEILEFLEFSESVLRLLREHSGLIFPPKLHSWISPIKSGCNAALQRAAP